jgi:hypothetical protein
VENKIQPNFLQETTNVLTYGESIFNKTYYFDKKNPINIHTNDDVGVILLNTFLLLNYSYKRRKSNIFWCLHYEETDEKK